MRTGTVALILSSLLLLDLAPTAGGDQERERLQGEWQISSVLDDGAMVSDSTVKSHLVREGRVSIRGALMSFISPENLQLHEAAFVLTPDVRPKAIDLAGHGRTRSKGIYMLDGDSLVVCLAPPDAKSRPDEFGSPKGSKNLLIWMKRDKAAARAVSRTAPVVVEAKRTTPPPPPPVDPAAKMRKELIGTWGHQNNDDVVLITFNPDGSFSSSKTPKGGFRKIFREPTRTSGAWKLEDGIIVVRVTASTERDLNGQILSYRVRSLTDTQVTLMDSTGRMHVNWKTP